MLIEVLHAGRQFDFESHHRSIGRLPLGVFSVALLRDGLQTFADAKGLTRIDALFSVFVIDGVCLCIKIGGGVSTAVYSVDGCD